MPTAPQDGSTQTGVYSDGSPWTDSDLDPSEYARLKAAVESRKQQLKDEYHAEMDNVHRDERHLERSRGAARRKAKAGSVSGRASPKRQCHSASPTESALSPDVAPVSAPSSATGIFPLSSL